MEKVALSENSTKCPIGAGFVVLGFWAEVGRGGDYNSTVSPTSRAGIGVGAFGAGSLWKGLGNPGRPRQKSFIL